MIQRKKNGHDYDNEEMNRRVNSIHQKSMQQKKKTLKKKTCQTFATLPPTLAKNSHHPLRLIGCLQPQPVGPFLDHCKPPRCSGLEFPGPPNRQHQLVARSLVENTGGVFIFTKPPSQKKKKNHGKKNHTRKKQTNKKIQQAPKKIHLKLFPHLFGFWMFPIFFVGDVNCSQQPAPSTALALGASVHFNDPRMHPI